MASRFLRLKLEMKIQTVQRLGIGIQMQCENIREIKTEGCVHLSPY